MSKSLNNAIYLKKGMLDTHLSCVFGGENKWVSSDFFSDPVHGISLAKLMHAELIRSANCFGLPYLSGQFNL
jgi:hypothetical protein